MLNIFIIDIASVKTQRDSKRYKETLRDTETVISNLNK